MSARHEPAPGSPAAVIGGGRMGAGIAHALLLAGARVRLVEVDSAALTSAQATIVQLVEASVRRGTVDENPAGLAARLTGHDSVNGIGDAELVIEAVPENPELKRQIFTRVEDVVSPAALLATNTSSISIDELAASLRHPGRFVGMHFFNPVPASKLVEIVVGSGSDGEAVGKAREWVAKMAKTAVTVTDSPGFASSRLGLALGLEAIRMVEEGVASPADIDTAMTLGYKHPVGPLRLTDIVGLDVRLDIATYLSQRLGSRFDPPRLLREKVERGELGKKTGQGFYTW
jgi:3-hydroxybutyryl-CoA dehydrogenase